MRCEAEFLRDPALARVLDAIEGGGHRALLVGGCVRNALLGKAVADIDIATDARPDNIITLAQAAGLRPVPTGIDHGTVTVVSDGTGFEVTTFRRDVETDGRRAIVAFSNRIEDDAARRDFTMNALYMRRDGQVIDPLGGLPDLQARRLRFVGTAQDRIREDYLRILRFFRFFAWYGQDYDPQALKACGALRAGLDGISAERIGHETRKILAAPDPVPAIGLMDRSGVLARILPGASAQALPALMTVEAGQSPNWLRRLTALGDGADWIDRLRLSRDEARGLRQRQQAVADGWSLDKAGYYLPADAARDVAMIAASRGRTLPDNWSNHLARAAEARLPIAAADLADSLQGPALGRGLKAAEALWIADGFTTTRDRLIAAAKETG